MNLKKTYFILLFAIFCTIAFAGCTNNKKTTGQIEADIQLGYDGIVKISSGNPLIATIKNNGEAFEGEFQVEVEDSSVSKIIIAQPFEIAENATKEITIELPVYIIQKAFNINIVSDKKTLYKDIIQARKVLPPDRQIMAVITDKQDSYRFLENIKLSNVILGEYYDKMASSHYYPGVTVDTQEDEEEKNKLEIVYLDNISQLDNIEKLSYFNYIYIGHNQNIKITEELEDNLNQWIKSGNTFIYETGAEYNKINSILPNSLNPYPVTKTDKININKLWGDLSLDSVVEIGAIDDYNKEDINILENNDAQIGYHTKIENGNIVGLFVNMGLEPLSSWSLKAPFIEDILNIYSKNNIQDYNSYPSGQFQYLSNQLPADKKPPYAFMLILFGLYILVVAPVGYFILKKMDKRDLAWISIPILSIVCIAIIYIFGMQTRYTKGIMNSISILTAKEDDSKMQIESDITIFNNKKDLLQLEWDKSENLNLSFIRQNDYYRYNYNEDPTTITKRVNSKLTYGNTNKYERYNATLWGTNYIQGSKSIPFEAKDLIKLKIDNDTIKIDVKNTTPYDLKNAFIKWGQGYIYVGDLEPGEERQLEQKLNNDLNVSFDVFLDKEMGLKQFDYSRRPTQEDREGMKLFELLMQRYIYSNYQYNPRGTQAGITNLEDVTLCALNYQNIGYDIKINGQEAEQFSTNIIEISSVLKFEEGSLVRIPMGIIGSSAKYYLDDEFTREGSIEYQYHDQYYRLYEKGIAQFDIGIPKEINVEKANIEIGQAYNEEDYYNKLNGQQANSLDDLKYTIYNVKEDSWDEVERTIELTDSRYINAAGHILLRVDFRVSQGANSYCQMIKGPSIAIEGSVE